MVLLRGEYIYYVERSNQAESVSEFAVTVNER